MQLGTPSLYEISDNVKSLTYELKSFRSNFFDRRPRFDQPHNPR